MGASTVEVTAIPRIHRGTSPGTPRTTSHGEVVVAFPDRAAVPTVQVSDRFPVLLGEEVCSCRWIIDTDAGFFRAQDQLPPWGPLHQAVRRGGENDPAPGVHDTADFWSSRIPEEVCARSRSPGAASLSGTGPACLSVVCHVRRPRSCRGTSRSVKAGRLCLVEHGRAAPSRPQDADPPPAAGMGSLKPAQASDVPACRAPERFRTFFGIRG